MYGHFWCMAEILDVILNIPNYEVNSTLDRITYTLKMKNSLKKSISDNDWLRPLAAGIKVPTKIQNKYITCAT